MTCYKSKMRILTHRLGRTIRYAVLENLHHTTWKDATLPSVKVVIIQNLHRQFIN